MGSGSGRGVRDESIYALYRGEEYLMEGTLDEIAGAQHVTRKTLQNRMRPSYRRNARERRKSGKERCCLNLVRVSERRWKKRDQDKPCMDVCNPPETCFFCPFSDCRNDTLPTRNETWFVREAGMRL